MKNLTETQKLKLKFFKETLQELSDTMRRNESVDNAIKDILKDDEFCRDFPLYISGIGSKYECMIQDCLAQLWNKPEEIKDNIGYLLYDVPSMNGEGLIHIPKTDKKYKISNVENLTEYLLDFYEIIG